VSAWDLVVVGAGPAGAATALGALKQDPCLRVLLLDRADFPRDKCCGDGIAPHVLDVLEQVGAGSVVDGWTPLTRLELARGDHTVTGALARPVHVIPRAVFDTRLVECAVAAGATLRRQRVTRVDVPEAGALGPVVLHCSPAPRTSSVRIEARVVVGADGAHSLVRSRVLPDAAGHRALAIRGYAPTSARRAGRQVIRYGDRRQPSYAWAFDRGDGLSNIGYGELVDDARDPAGVALTRAVLLAQLERLLPGALEGATCWRGHHLPLSGWTHQQPDGPVLLVGDAAGLVNPMTGEGIYYAVATGVLAGRAAAAALAGSDPDAAGARHRVAVRRLLGTHLRHTWVASRLSRSPAVVDAGIRAASSSPQVFDDLVEIGLGDGRITSRLAAGLARGLLHRREPEYPADYTATPPPLPSQEPQ